MEDFEKILSSGLDSAARERGWQYGPCGALEWAKTGCAFLAMALSGGSQACVRLHQSRARMTAGPVLLECSQYEGLVNLCLDGKTRTEILLSPDNGSASISILTRDLFLEMLDFLREG